MRAVCAFLVAVLLVSGFAPYGSAVSGMPVATVPPAESSSATDAADIVFPTDRYRDVEAGEDTFSEVFLDYIQTTDKADENYIVSPLSFRAALCLAIMGASGNTEHQLLEAAGFDDIDALRDWYLSVLQSITDFAVDADDGSGREFSIANSIWSNEDSGNTFKDSYVDILRDIFQAQVASAPGRMLASKVNHWVNKATNGFISEIADDLSEVDAALINALYLKTSWLDAFEESMTQDRDFTSADGIVVSLPFMEQTNDYLYGETEDTQLMVLPMRGDISFVVWMGEDPKAAYDIAERCSVHVCLPKTEIQSLFSSKELCGYLESVGAVDALSPEIADFSNMTDASWYIEDILQKARFKMDEEGIEAAAVTAILMEATALEVPVTPKEFIADRPFHFAILDSNNALLFYGQMVRGE